MRFLALAIAGALAYSTSVQAAAVGSDFARRQENFRREDCGAPETVTITQTVSANTVTIALENSSQLSSSIASAVSVDETAASVSQELTPINPTATTTTILTTTTAWHFTYTEVVPVVSATKASSDSAYYFVGVNGTTSWLNGNIPPATSSMIVGTTTVTVSPEPLTTSSTTVMATEKTTRTVQSSYTPKVPTTYSWSNSTATTLPTSIVLSTGSGYTYSTGAPTVVTHSSHPLLNSSTTSCTDIASGYSFSPIPSGISSSFSKRQVGATVTATINGQTVTWINTYDGQSTTPSVSSTPPPAPPPVTSTAPPVTSTLPSLTTTSTESVINATSTSPAPAATSSCGISGNWILGFDDLPKYSPPNNDTAPTPPIFNPHDLLFFSDGWSYVPPPNDPFPPQAGSLLAEFINATSANSSTTNSPDAGALHDGSFGAGPRASSDMFWLNVTSAYVGCNNSQAAVNCDFEVKGYHYDEVSQKEQQDTRFAVPISGCQDFQNCHLQFVDFGDLFTGVSSIGFSASVNGTAVNWFIDSIAMSWWNTTCAAGLYRTRHVHA
ncbi:MAG: hypothetical protein Q9227_006846 [Pyrenula ochraceoflavens]